jgi:hypothetical protein
MVQSFGGNVFFAVDGIGEEFINPNKKKQGRRTNLVYGTVGDAKTQVHKRS